MGRFIISCFILELCACTGGFQSNPAVVGAAGKQTSSTTPASGNQWSAVALESSSCSGTYQISAGGTAMVMTIFAGQGGAFSGIAAIAGQGNQPVTGSCANGTISFTVAGQQYTGSYGN